jgi:hypothetical protein
VTPSGFVPGAGESNCIWNQGEVEGLNRVRHANTITFRVQSVISRTPMYTNGFVGVLSVIFVPNALMQILGPLEPFGTSPLIFCLFSS